MNHAHRDDVDEGYDLTWRGFVADLIVMLGIVACLYAALLFLPGMAS